MVKEEASVILQREEITWEQPLPCLDTKSFVQGAYKFLFFKGINNIALSLYNFQSSRY